MMNDRGQGEVINTAELQGYASAQLVELRAVTEALKHGEGNKTNIYTDSA